MEKPNYLKKLLKLSESDKRILNAYQNFVIETSPKIKNETKIKEKIKI